MTTTTRPFDAARYLDTPEALAEYLDAALETGDAAFIARSLGTVARAKGMTEVARDAGMGRESLYKALSEQGNPELATVLRVMKALGLRLSAATTAPTAAAVSAASLLMPAQTSQKCGSR